jgi:GAF domain-containing protein
MFSALFSTARYPLLTDKERARIIYLLSSGLLIVGTIITLGLRNSYGQNVWEQALANPIMALALLLFYFLNIASYVFVRRGALNLGALSMVLTWAIGFGGGIASTGAYTPTAGMVFALIVLVTALLLRSAGVVLGFVLALLTLVVGLVIRQTIPVPPTPAPVTQLISGMLILLITSGVTYLFLRFSRLSRQESALDVMAERLKLADLTAQITQRISNRRNLDEVLSEAVNYIIANYPDVYHAQIFLVDDHARRARLAASTGEAGRKLLAILHSLEVGGQSVVGQVTATGKLTIARARAVGSVHRPNEYLPDTRVEAAFPLRIGDQVIGALDLQSKIDRAFEEAVQPIFQTLADHIAIAIDNARLFQDAQQQLEMNAALASQSQQALLQVEELNRRLTSRAWSEYLLGYGGRMGLDVDLVSGARHYNIRWTPTLAAAAEANAMQEREVDGERVLVVPVRVRGEPVGAMEFVLDADGQLTEEDRQLALEISERFGLAAENARLYEESQRSAQREALISEVGARLQASSNMEATLNEAARSLQQALKAQRVAIRLGEPPAANGTNGAAT